jgi:hypothetical protein
MGPRRVLLETVGRGSGQLTEVRALKLSNKDPATMTAGAINKERDKLRLMRSALTDEFIAAGRGHERPSDQESMSDLLVLRSRAVDARYDALSTEVEHRYGPRARYLDSLPTRGFGPRRR